MSLKISSDFRERLDVKLTFYYTTIFFVLSLMLCSFFFYRVGHNLLKQMDKILEDESLEFINILEHHAYDLRQASLNYEANNRNKKFYPIFFRILAGDGSVYFESANIRKHSSPLFEQSRGPLIDLLNIGRARPFLYYSKKFTASEGTEYKIQIATDIKRIKKTLRNFLENIFIVIPLLLIVSIGCGMFVAKKYRAIVRNITSVTNRITSLNLQERLTVPAVQDEFRDLTVTINSMINRLEKSFKEIKQFTADVSHELRTPLFALKGELEIALSQKRNDAEYREAIAESLERINFLIKMVNDLLLIARFDENSMELKLEYLNLGEIVRDLHDFYLPMAQDKKLQFSIEQCDDVVFASDKTRIRQLFSNVIDNAIKFSPEQGSVTLSLTAAESAVKFLVKDTGIGIPAADIPGIFNRFYQGDKSRSGASRGSGLGLHICKRIAEAHHGSISIERNQGPGVTAIVTLPLPA
jgi:heavy metal sensor kinase